MEALTKVLQQDVGHQDALVMLLNRDQVQAQLDLIDAAIAAGIPHIIPSSFGIGTRDLNVRITPIGEGKARMEDHVVKKAEEGTVTFTSIQTGVFFDWALNLGVFLNTKGGDRPTAVFDGGDIPFSVTVMDDIGKAVAAVLLQSHLFRNKFVFVHSAVVTQNQLLAYAEEAAPDREFKVLQLDTAELEKQAWEKYNNGERGPEVMHGFLPRATFGKRMGKFEETENERLGIEVWTDEKVKWFIASYFK